MKSPQKKEVEWYRKNGLYPERIKKDYRGREYVIGDWSWNRNNPKKEEHIEWATK